MYLLVSAGGYKGFGLSMMVEIFCGILAGSNFANNVRKWGNHDAIAHLVHITFFSSHYRFRPTNRFMLFPMLNHNVLIEALNNHITDLARRKLHLKFDGLSFEIQSHGLWIMTKHFISLKCPF